MPRGAPHPCRRPGCPALVPRGGGAYCETHATRTPQAEARRTKGRHPFYGTAAWRRLRAAFLRANPLCACGRLATLAHHRQALTEGGAALDEANLIGSCASCHAREPGHGFQGYNARRRRGGHR